MADESTTFFEVVSDNLSALGLEVDADPVKETLRIRTRGSSTPILGVVVTPGDTVVFYRVWEASVPADRVGDLGEFALRSNESLFVATLEHSPSSEAMSVRAGFSFDGLPALPEQAVRGILLNLLSAITTAAADHEAAFRSLLAGASVDDALRLRTTHGAGRGPGGD